MKAKYLSAMVGMLLCGLAARVQGAVDFTVSPASVTTAYSGRITLTITGFTAGQAVRIDKVADLNSNGIIDGGEPIVDSVIVTDGMVTSIGGVRNGNVPGDEDGVADGQATVRFHFPAVNMVLDNITGNYLFRVSDPNGVFADVVHAFQIQPGVLAQGVTGTLFRPDGTTPRPNAVVLLVSNGSGGGGAVTDGSGHFTIYSAPGDYALLTMGGGYLSDQAAGSVTVSAGVIGSHNVVSVASDRTIAGNVSDSADSHGLPGMLTIGESSGGKLSITFTDLSGNFSLPAISEHWSVGPDSSAGADRNYVGAQNKPDVDATSGSVTGINIQLTKATVLVYGTVMDNLGNPVPKIDIWGDDNAHTFEGGGLSYPSGNYFVGLLPGTVWVSPSGDTLTQLGYALVSQTDNISAVAGHAYTENFTLALATTHLRGHVLDNNSNPVSDLSISVSPVNGGSSVAQAKTGSDGSFDLAVVGGALQFHFDSSDLAGRGLVEENLTITVVDGVDQNNISLVLPHVTAHITGTVSTNTGGHLADLGVFAQATINSISYNAYVTTGSNGSYSLGVINGSWFVTLDSNRLGQLGYGQPAGQSVGISGADGTANFTVSSQTIGEANVNKTQRFDQTSGTSVVPKSSGFEFSANVMGGDTSPTFPAAPNTVSCAPGSGVSGITMPYVADFGQWFYSTTYATQALLDSAFANGSYGFSLNGGGATIAVNLAGDLYPNTPQITASAGTWSAGVLVVNAAEELTLTSNTFSTNFLAGHSHVAIYIGDLGSVDNHAGNTATWTIPAGTLTAGRNYYANVDFVRVVDAQSPILGGVAAAAYGTATEFTIQVVSAQAPSLTAQPANQTVVAGQDASFTAAASGNPLPTYHWQVSTDGGGSWTDVPTSSPYSGQTTGTLTITGVSLAMNGYQFRCVASNGMGPDAVSNPATLTVNQATATVSLGGLSATYDGAPHSATATTLPAGLVVTFTYDGSASAPTNAGSYAVVGTINDANYQGAVSGTLVVAKVPLTAKADDQSKAQGTANPDLTVTYTGFVSGETPAVLDALPTASTTATTSSPVGTYPITLSGGADNNYALALQNGVLTIVPENIAPSFTTQPSNRTVIAGSTASFAAAAAGTPSPTLKWQFSTDSGSSWTDVPSSSPYSGVTTGTLTITGVTAAMNGDQYRCLASNAVQSNVASNAATLVVAVIPARPAGFDAAGYLARYPDLQAAFGSLPDWADRAWMHYWLYGLDEGRVFDTKFRALEYPLLYGDLAALVGDPHGALLHWLNYGRAEGRMGRVPAGFDVAAYLGRYSDLAAAFGSLPYPQQPVAAWDHYVTWGINEGRTDGDFDPEAYLAMYGDLRAAFGDNWTLATMHWYLYGRYEGRRIPAGFDARGYLGRYEDLQLALGDDLYGGWVHYLDWGVNEGRVYDELFRPDEYLAMYPDLRAAFGTDRQKALLHWLYYGQYEGRLGRFP